MMMRIFNQTALAMMAAVCLWIGAFPLTDAEADGAVLTRIEPSAFAPIPAKLKTSRAGHTATLLNDGRVLITGGFRSGRFPSPALRTAEIYNPATRTFTALPGQMRSARTSHAAARLADGRVLLTGGQTNNNGNGTNGAELFDPVTGSFTALASRMLSPRGGHAAVSLSDGTVLIAGGFNAGCSVGSAEIFNPSTQRFTALGSSMVAPRSDFSATLLANGTALIAGGGSCDSVYNTAELFNPVTKRFTTLASRMTVSREGHASSRLANGSVLLSGGGYAVGSRFLFLNTAELFSPSTQRFAAVSTTMTTARFFHSQTTLNDGSVLIAGGLNQKPDGSFLILNTAERFVP
jgi:hypothetical protein